MTGGLSTQVKMNVKPIGAFKCGLIRQVVFERRGLKIQGPLYTVCNFRGRTSALGRVGGESQGSSIPVYYEAFLKTQLAHKHLITRRGYFHLRGWFFFQLTISPWDLLALILFLIQDCQNIPKQQYITMKNMIFSFI